jgi:hypothetical protein
MSHQRTKLRLHFTASNSYNTYPSRIINLMHTEVKTSRAVVAQLVEQLIRNQ